MNTCIAHSPNNDRPEGSTSDVGAPGGKQVRGDRASIPVETMSLERDFLAEDKVRDGLLGE